ncbi:DUF4129 domain-containing protein [Chloroflexi bacterium TSY]|nr:DUF4129 domain-containing protein [Chloroflexi bacterium TSY]
MLEQKFTTSPTEFQPAIDDAENELGWVYYDRSWIRSLLRPFLIAVLAVCITVAFLAFLRHIISDIPPAYTASSIFLGVCAALLGSFSTTWLAQPGQRARRNTGIRAAEILLLLLLVRLTSWITVGNWPTLMNFITRPVESLMDGAFILGAFIVSLSWVLATTLTGDLLRMGLQPDEIYAAELRNSGTRNSDGDQTPPNYTDRRGVLNGFIARWVAGGVFLVLLAGGTRLGQAENGFFALTQQNIAPAVITANVVYFLTGLILLSTGQLAVLRSRWTLERVPSAPNVLRNWPLYTLLFIVGIGILAMLMPFGGTFYLAQIIKTIVATIYMIVTTVFQIFASIFFILMSLFSGEPVEEEPPPPPTLEPPPLFPEATETASNVPPWLGGSIFWVITALLLGYAAYIYFSGRGVNFSWLKTLLATLRARWLELWGAYTEWQETRVRGDKATGLANVPFVGELTSWLRLRNLEPDQQVRYFYLTTLHRAQKAGIPRYRSETPAQYAPRLLQQLRERLLENAPQAKDDGSKGNTQDSELILSEETRLLAQELERDDAIHELTDAFVQVRYAGQSTTEEQIPYLKRLWERIKRRLRFRV